MTRSDTEHLKAWGDSCNLTFDKYCKMLKDMPEPVDRLALIVLHPADLAEIPESEESAFPRFVPNTLAGVEAWSRPQIERGHPRMYKNWRTAIDGLKGVLPDRDIDELIRRQRRLMI